MDLLRLNFFLVLLGVLASGFTVNTLLMDTDIPLKRCRYIRNFDLFQALCNDLKLGEVPHDLKSSIEVLDARENRIRKLDNDSLRPYRSLKFLLLQDNFISEITNAAFSSVDYLEVIDLTKNGLTGLPQNLFQLQFLRHLYINENHLTDDALALSDIKSPLLLLELAGNKLTKFPQLSPLSNLVMLNISHNPITTLTTEDLAPLCSLKELNIVGIKLSFNQSCDCHLLRRWIKERGILIYPDIFCPIMPSTRCEDAKYTNETKILFGDCAHELEVKAEAKRARTTWIWIASCISAFISSVFVVLCCIHKKNKSQRKRLKEEQIVQANNANTEQLLGCTTTQE